MGHIHIHLKICSNADIWDIRTHEWRQAGAFLLLLVIGGADLVENASHTRDNFIKPVCFRCK
jgi:hypothetical protein